MTTVLIEAPRLQTLCSRILQDAADPENGKILWKNTRKSLNGLDEECDSDTKICRFKDGDVFAGFLKKVEVFFFVSCCTDDKGLLLFPCKI